MPEPAFDPEKETRHESVKLVASNDAPTFQVCMLCLGPNRTPTLHTACDSHDSTDPADKGKADDADVSGVIDKELGNVASSSSTAAEKQDNESLPSSSSQQDQKPELATIVASLPLEPSAKERPIVPADPAADGNAQTGVASFESEHPGALGPSSKLAPSAVHKGIPMTEDIEDGAEAPAKILQETATSKADEASKAFWQNREQKLFRDSPDQAGIYSGLGQNTCMQLMQLPEEREHAADPMQQVDEREEASTFVTPLVTYRVPGFSIDLADGVIPFSDEYQVEGCEKLGFERGDREEPMDDQEQPPKVLIGGVWTCDLKKFRHVQFSSFDPYGRRNIPVANEDAGFGY